MPGLGELKNATAVNTYSSSDLMNDYVYQTLAAKAKIKRDDVIDVNTDASAREMISMTYIVPARSDMWLFRIDVTGITRAMIKPLMKSVLKSETAIFWFVARRPREFFQVKELLDEYNAGINSLWLEYYDQSDVELIIGEGLSYTDKKNLRRYYGSDPSSLFKVQHGIKNDFIHEWKDVTELLGVSPGYAVKILLDIAKGYGTGNTRSQKAMVRQLKAYTDSVGTQKALREFKKLSNALMQYKVLYMRRKVYDRMPKDGFGPNYDNKSIKQFIRWGRAIEPLSLSLIGYLNAELQKESTWFTFNNVLEWVYKWYSVREEVGKAS